MWYCHIKDFGLEWYKRFTRELKAEVNLHKYTEEIHYNDDYLLTHYDWEEGKFVLFAMSKEKVEDPDPRYSWGCERQQVDSIDELFENVKNFKSKI